MQNEKEDISGTKINEMFFLLFNFHTYTGHVTIRNIPQFCDLNGNQSEFYTKVMG